jgi:hypothetical protein
MIQSAECGFEVRCWLPREQLGLYSMNAIRNMVPSEEQPSDRTGTRAWPGAWLCGAASRMDGQPLKSHPLKNGMLLLVAGSLCSCIALGAGLWMGRQSSPTAQLPPMWASAAAVCDTMAVATGPVGRDSEGVFFLDFITGDLQCLVYYPRAGGFGAHYFGNVLPHLGGGGKNSKYLMVTGQAVVAASSGGARPAASLVYVTDTTTGMFAAYAIPWDPSAESSGRVQTGAVVYVGGGPIRNFQLRDPGQNKPAAVVDPNKK